MPRDRALYRARVKRRPLGSGSSSHCKCSWRSASWQASSRTPTSCPAHPTRPWRPRHVPPSRLGGHDPGLCVLALAAQAARLGPDHGADRLVARGQPRGVVVGDPNFVRMVFPAVTAFYLNSAPVRDLFLAHDDRPKQEMLADVEA